MTVANSLFPLRLRFLVSIMERVKIVLPLLAVRGWPGRALLLLYPRELWVTMSEPSENSPVLAISLLYKHQGVYLHTHRGCIYTHTDGVAHSSLGCGVVWEGQACY